MPAAYLIDMDGVLVRGKQCIPGAVEFIERLSAAGTPFLILTNNSRFTPQDHHSHLREAGLGIPPEAIFTSALATAQFLNQQNPHATTYVIGESGLTTALQSIGYQITDSSPHYVVLGETVFFLILTALQGHYSSS